MVSRDTLRQQPPGRSLENPIVARKGSETFERLREAARLADSLSRMSGVSYLKLGGSGMTFEISCEGKFSRNYLVTVVGLPDLSFADQWQARTLCGIYQQHLNNPDNQLSQLPPAGRRHRSRS